MMGYLHSNKLTLFLWGLIMISAFAVIYSSHSARQHFIQWQALLKQAQDYEVEWGQLLLEKSTMASYSRLETVASEKLHMTEPTKDQIVLIGVAD